MRLYDVVVPMGREPYKFAKRGVDVPLSVCTHNNEPIMLTATQYH